MLCSISGTETNDPVVSPKSGGIFDRKHATTYISASGKDPLNDEPMTVDELISVANSGLPILTPPKPAEFNSLPTMLQAFQNEWDAVALEVFSLRKQLHSTRQDLSAALYKYDAAVRVAATALREKEEAQKALQEISEAFASKSVQSRENGNESIEKDTYESAQALETISTFVQIVNDAREVLFSLHKQSKPKQIVTVKTEISVSRTTADLALKGSDSLVVDPESGKKIVAGPSFGTLCLPEGIKRSEFSSLAFLRDNGENLAVGITEHRLHVLPTDETIEIPVDSVKELITHPSTPYFVVITTENKWVLAGKTGVIHSSEPSTEPITAADFHVDGALIGLASSGKVDVVDLTKFAVVSSVEMLGFTTITKIHFALNGYWLFAQGTTDQNVNEIRIYDLRKSSLVYTFDVSENAEFAVDPMCQVLVVYDNKSKSLHVHLYAKKGKKWLENVHVEKCGALSGLAVDVQGSGDTHLVNFVALSGNDLVSYEISANVE